MQFGICAPRERAEAICRAGYDFVELSLAATLRPEEAEATVMSEVQTSLATIPAAAEAFNGFLPPDLRVVGPDANPARQERYLKAALARAARIGGKVIVFGSGRSRQVPEGFGRDDAERQIVEFLRVAARLAADQNLLIAIEPLNTSECNILNSVSEAVHLAEWVDHPHVGVLSDLYHVDWEGQSYEETRAAGHWLKHVHVAGAEGRRVPTPSDTTYLVPFFRVLREMGYRGRISIEGASTGTVSEDAEALVVLREAWRRA